MDISIRMSQKEVSRYDIIQKTIQKELRNKEASEILHLTSRHIRRIKERVEKEGIQGLVHKSRGKPSNRKIPKEEENRIRTILKENYYDFTPAFATEKLREKHNITHDRKTIQRMMIEEGLRKPKRKKKNLSPPYSPDTKSELSEMIIRLPTRIFGTNWKPHPPS